MRRRRKLSTVGLAAVISLLLMIPAGMGAWTMHVNTKLAHADRTYNYGLLRTNDIWYFTCRYDCPTSTNVLAVFPVLMPKNEDRMFYGFSAENACFEREVEDFRGRIGTHWYATLMASSFETSITSDELYEKKVSYYLENIHVHTAWDLILRDAGYAVLRSTSRVDRTVFFYENDHASLTSSVARYYEKIGEY